MIEGPAQRRALHRVHHRPVDDPDDRANSRGAQAARDLAKQGYSDDRAELPQPLRNLSYDQYRDIRFKPDQALWSGQKLFQIQFFHLGFLYQQPVRINVVSGGQPALLPYQPGMFNYGANNFGDSLPANLGFAGFRIHYPLHRPDYFDELAVYLGASYFRILGRKQIYGASARGLASDTAEHTLLRFALAALRMLSD